MLSHMKKQSLKAKIKLPKTKLQYIEHVLSRYFSEKIPMGFESLDRRFSVTKKCVVYFQSRTRQIAMPLHKLIACLSMTKPQLFQYLTTSNKSRQVTPFSFNEKYLIKNIVRLAHKKKTKIPCLKIRNL